MKRILFTLTLMVLTSGCICCCTQDGFDLGSLGLNGTDANIQQTTETTLQETTTTVRVTTTLRTTTTTMEETETTQTTVPQVNIGECLNKKDVESDEVVFLYTNNCCRSLKTTVDQLGSYSFKKIELGISITNEEKNILDCLGLNMDDMKTMQSAQFWCPASGEQLIVTKDEFIGASDTIKNFAVRCREKALQNG
ncbi:MAG: hypothetical protein NTU61_01895 [Candidatus Altiarchaeota archaeon]|nr:hypothetical protein [Candidatus Altiarchaeota archaeon]